MNTKKREFKPEILGLLLALSLLAFLIPFFMFVNMKSPTGLYTYMYTAWFVVIVCLFLVSRKIK